MISTPDAVKSEVPSKASAAKLPWEQLSMLNCSAYFFLGCTAFLQPFQGMRMQTHFHTSASSKYLQTLC
jgi:hypothetical protein